MTTLQPLQAAQLRWDGNTPEAAAFGDIYFSRDNGLAESRHVFLDGNRLQQRWQQLSPRGTFVIGETGFGTGLNFLLAWQLWQQTAPADARLFFISTELYPLTHSELGRALGHWPTLAPLAQPLLAQYPPLLPGYHWLRFGNVTLLLLFGDALHTLPQLADSQHPAIAGRNPWAVDAWFLDGFAPAKNPQLWQQALLGDIAALSKPGTTLATFTAAGQVRRDLGAHGFAVQKVPGYGSKREMIVATFAAPGHPTPHTAETPWLLPSASHATPQQVAVIGAGLAGCHIARALAERGVSVHVYERHAAAAQEASGNPQGALYTKLSASAAALSRFSLASLQYALRHYRQSLPGKPLEDCGLLQLHDERDDALQALLGHAPALAQWVDAQGATEHSGLALQRGGWWLPQAGWIHPAALCRALLDHPAIHTHFGCPVETLQQQEGWWQLRDGQQQVIGSAPHVVIACANSTRSFQQTQWLPLRPVRGQVSQLPATDASTALRCVLCDEGYLTPAANGQHCLGASFVPGDTDTALRASEQEHNLQLLEALSPALAAGWQDAALGGRAALRATTPDHLPLAGPLPDRDAFLRNYAALQHNARAVIGEAGHYIGGLWLFGAFGGRGLCYIPLAAELLASQLLNTPRPLPRDLQAALAPARFVIRELVRRNAGR